MTNDEKAKAYDDALERARKIHNEIINNEIIGFPGQIIEIFPQLRESESEDERIRKFLLDYAIEMIAGLESDISLSTYDGIKGHDPDAEAELTQWQKARGYLEKQKEQKPVDLSEMMVHKEPYIAPVPTPMVADEQKPAEWSEEDKNKIESIKGLITTGRFSDTNTIRTIWKLLDSIHPRHSWKPSEEQIYSLGTVVNGIGEASVGSIGYNLKELYGHLKKLI